MPFVFCCSGPCPIAVVTTQKRWKIHQQLFFINFSCRYGVSLFGWGALRQRGGGHGCKSTQLQALLSIFMLDPHMEEKKQLRFRYHDLLSDKTCGFLQLGCAFSQSLFDLSPPHTRGAAKTPKAWNFLFLTIHLLLGIIISAFRQVLKWWYSYYMLFLVFAWL